MPRKARAKMMIDSTTAIQPVRLGTPLEDHLEEAGLLVKREDLSCPPPGPPFSKMRGVYAHVAKRHAEGVKLFGVLDTFHSQAGHAVAYACKLLGVECVNYFPVYKRDVESRDGDVVTLKEYRPPQLRSSELGASLFGLPAGRSAVLYHSAKRDVEARGGYMMPNALKLPETVEETAAEVVRTFELADRTQFDVLRNAPWLVSASSGTIATGVMKGLREVFGHRPPKLILHMGYSRSREAVYKYMSGYLGEELLLDATRYLLAFVDEGYAYKDVARPGPTPPWPCNDHYDLKALRWWLREGRERYGRAVFWNIG
jgi:hypothetical protein